ncbi:MAG: hypothetical protein ACT4ON_04905 [Bacteroidota bacterium]
MKTIEYIFLFFILQTLVSCSSNKKESISKNNSVDSIQKVALPDTIATNTENEFLNKDSTVLTVSKNEEDLPINGYLTEELKPIRANYKKLNSISEWTSVDKRKLVMAPENGVAEYYYIDRSLQKIIARYPNAKEISEFYLINGQLSLAILKSILTESNYDELITDKNYFKNSRLLHKIHSQDCGAPFAEDYIKEEQKRILGIYNKLKAKLNG